MTKKTVKKTSAKKKSASKASKKTSSKKTSGDRTEKSEDKNQRMLIENFVSLQAVMTDLSSKLNGLTEKVSKLLDLFEESAKALTEKGTLSQIGENKEVSDKLNKILDQNKVLAQGVALLHESNSQKEEMENSDENMQVPGQIPQQPHPSIRNSPQNPEGMEEGNYQRSISSRY